MPTIEIKVTLAQLQTPVLIDMLASMIEEQINQAIEIKEADDQEGSDGDPLLAAYPVDVDDEGNVTFGVEYRRTRG